MRTSLAKDLFGRIRHKVMMSSYPSTWGYYTREALRETLRFDDFIVIEEHVKPGEIGFSFVTTGTGDRKLYELMNLVHRELQKDRTYDPIRVGICFEPKEFDIYSRGPLPSYTVYVKARRSERNINKIGSIFVKCLKSM